MKSWLRAFKNGLIDVDMAYRMGKAWPYWTFVLAQMAIIAFLIVRGQKG